MISQFTRTWWIYDHSLVIIFRSLTQSADCFAGALFCFKRGHMRKLVAVPNMGSGFEGLVTDRGESSGDETGDEDMVLR